MDSVWQNFKYCCLECQQLNSRVQFSLHGTAASIKLKKKLNKAVPLQIGPRTFGCSKNPVGLALLSKLACLTPTNCLLSDLFIFGALWFFNQWLPMQVQLAKQVSLTSSNWFKTFPPRVWVSWGTRQKREKNLKTTLAIKSSVASNKFTVQL